MCSQHHITLGSIHRTRQDFTTSFIVPKLQHIGILRLFVFLHYRRILSHPHTFQRRRHLCLQTDIRLTALHCRIVTDMVPVSAVCADPEAQDIVPVDPSHIKSFPLQQRGQLIVDTAFAPAVKLLPLRMAVFAVDGDALIPIVRSRIDAHIVIGLVIRDHKTPLQHPLLALFRNQPA